MDTLEAPPSWQLIGDLARNYERYFVPAIFRPWASDLLDLAAPLRGERVLDVACGTGIVSRLAAERVGAAGVVVGVDINPAMLEVASSQHITGATIDWRQTSADALPFADGAFDLVLCQQALQFFADRAAALRELHRVLRAGGGLALSTWRDVQHSPGYAALADAMARHVGPEPASFIRLTGSLDSREVLQSELTAGGFREVVVRSATRKIRFPSPEDFVWQFVQATPLALIPCVNEADAPTRASVIREVAAALRRYVDEDGLAFPIEAHVVTGRK
jgi:ubiquinone/menaquinone biosynthesis C-methylase UbiE